MREIIDFHTHPFFDQRENSCIYREEFPLSYEEEIRDLKKAGIGRICGSVISREGYRKERGFEQIEELNQKALEIHEIQKEFYVPGFHIHPAFVRESMETIEQMHQKGFRLIGELVPYMQGWSEYGLDYGSRELTEILRLAGEYGMVVSYHTIVEQQEQMEQMIADNPEVTFVAAHPGERESYMLHLERLCKYENAFLDLSGTGLFRYGMLYAGVQKAGAEKFLFGTDYPIINPAMYVGAVEFEHISEADRELIFAGNAKRILGL